MKQTTSIRVDPDLWASFKKLAIAFEMKTSALVEIALREKLARHSQAEKLDAKVEKAKELLREELQKNEM